MLNFAVNCCGRKISAFLDISFHTDTGEGKVKFVGFKEENFQQ